MLFKEYFVSGRFLIGTGKNCDVGFLHSKPLHTYSPGGHHKLRRTASKATHS